MLQNQSMEKSLQHQQDSMRFYAEQLILSAGKGGYQINTSPLRAAAKQMTIGRSTTPNRFEAPLANTQN